MKWCIKALDYYLPIHTQTTFHIAAYCDMWYPVYALSTGFCCGISSKIFQVGAGWPGSVKWKLLTSKSILPLQKYAEWLQVQVGFSNVLFPLIWQKCGDPLFFSYFSEVMFCLLPKSVFLLKFSRGRWRRVTVWVLYVQNKEELLYSCHMRVVSTQWRGRHLNNSSTGGVCTNSESAYGISQIIECLVRCECGEYLAYLFIFV